MAEAFGTSTFDISCCLVLCILALIFLFGHDEVKEFDIKVLLPICLFVLIVWKASSLVIDFLPKERMPYVPPPQEETQVYRL